MSETQISAYISIETKDLVERYSNAHGMKKGALVEQALLHHLQALRDLPADVIIPPRLALTEASLSQVAAAVVKPRKPTKAIEDLMAKRKKPAKAKRAGQ